MPVPQKASNPDEVINTPIPEKPHQGKRRKTIVWSVNVLTVVMFMVDPRYALCESKYKQVSKRFRKALEIVLRCIVTESTNYMEYSAPLIVELQQKYLHSDSFTSIRHIDKQLPVNAKIVNPRLPDGCLDERKWMTILFFTIATMGMSDDTCDYDETLPNFMN